MGDIEAYRRERQIRWQTAAPIKTIWILLMVTWVLFLIPFCGVSFVGWACNFIAFRRSLEVINLGNKIGGLVPLLTSVTLSPIMFIIGLLMFTFMEPKKPQTPEPPQQQHIQPTQPQLRPQTATRETNV